MYPPDYSTEVLTGGVYTGNDAWSRNRGEIDNCFKLYYLTEGELCVQGEEDNFLLGAGQFYFINGEKLRAMSCKQGFSAYWLLFLPKDGGIYRKLLDAVTVSDIAAEEVFPGMSPKGIEKDLEGMNGALRRLYLESVRVEILLRSVVIYLLEGYAREYLADTSVSQIEPAIRYIRSHYAEAIRLDELAESCGFSYTYFHKLFTRTMRITPANYINRYRMNASLTLLVEERYKVHEVGSRLGYFDKAHFSRSFKKYFGITPSDYKNGTDSLFL